MAYSNKFVNYGGKVYLKSSYVFVYPSAYRGTNGTIPFDPEARLNTEKNIVTHSCLSANKSYIISWVSNELVCVIGGYYFRLNLSASDLGTEGETSFANINLLNAALTGEETTKILGSWATGTVTTLDSLVEANYIFTGLYFSAIADGLGLSLPITTNTGTPLSASGSINYTEINSALNYLDTNNIKYAKSITGNLVDASGDRAVASIYTNTVGVPVANVATGKSSIAFGIDTIASLDGAVVAGKYNLDKENALFILGNGTADDQRSNSVVIYTNGNVDIAGYMNGTAQKALTAGFEIKGGTTEKILTVSETYTLGPACAKAFNNSSGPSALSETGENLVTERDIYNGLPKFNSVHDYTSSTDFYAPVSSGTAGQLLLSQGDDTAPEWKDTSTINAGSATKLATARTLWGQSFDGTANITGALSSTGNITPATTNVYNIGAAGNTYANIYATTVRATTFYASSDERLKHNIINYKYHDSILDVPVKEFDYKETGVHTIGFIAQELKEKFPELVNEDSCGYLSIAESKLVYLLLEEVKQLKEEMKALRG